MTTTDILHILNEAMLVTGKLAGPALAISLIVGIVIALAQSVLQIQDQALAFVAKLAATGAALVIAGPWMLQTIIGFFTELMKSIPSLVH